MKKKPPTHRPAPGARNRGLPRARRVWRLNPVERVRESGRRYSRKKARARPQRECRTAWNGP